MSDEKLAAHGLERTAYVIVTGLARIGRAECEISVSMEDARRIRALLASWRERGEEIERLNDRINVEARRANEAVALLVKAEAEVERLRKDLDPNEPTLSDEVERLKAELESWKAANLYPHEYRMAVEELVSLKAELAAANERRKTCIREEREIRDAHWRAIVDAANERADKAYRDLIYRENETDELISAANERTERLEKYLDSQHDLWSREKAAHISATWDITADGHLAAIAGAREALRPAAPAEGCPNCNGTGEIAWDVTCARCDGKGEKPKQSYVIDLGEIAKREEPLPLGHPHCDGGWIYESGKCSNCGQPEAAHRRRA